MKYKIYLIDDEPIVRSSLKSYLNELGYHVDTFENGSSAIAKIRYDKPDLILLDLFLPDKNGIEILKDIQTIDKELLVILITGYGTVEAAVSAIKEGAYDFLSKPLEAGKIELIVKKALKTIALKKEIESFYLKEVNKFKDSFIIAEDSIMNQILGSLKNAAATNVPILITGESGTGKEILAKAVYYYSHRVSKPFISINCSAIPTGILESELFGYEKGAFTGALAKGKKGIFEVADGGTVFFDEIGDLDHKAQAKLLRFLQEKEIQKVGSTTLNKVDVRIIAATNKDLMLEVGKKRFREDLYYRLNVFNIVVPPLKERKEDIIPLCNFFVRKFCDEFKKELLEISDDLKELLLKMPWKGNVRELQNTIARAVIMCRGNRMKPSDVVFESTPDMPSDIESRPVAPLKEIERKYVLESLKKLGNNKTLTAKKLNISVNTLKSIINRAPSSAPIKK